MKKRILIPLIVLLIVLAFLCFLFLAPSYSLVIKLGSIFFLLLTIATGLSAYILYSLFPKSKIVLFVVVILALIFSLQLLLLPFFGQHCPDEEIKRIVSSDGRYTAVVWHWSCGALTQPQDGITIVENKVLSREMHVFWNIFPREEFDVAFAEGDNSHLVITFPNGISDTVSFDEKAFRPKRTVTFNNDQLWKVNDVIVQEIKRTLD